MSVMLQSTTPASMAFDVRQGTKPNGANTFIEGNTTAVVTLASNRWYKLVASFVNSNSVQAGTYRVTGTLLDMGLDGLAISPSTVATMGPVTITNVDVTSSRNLFFVLRGVENLGIDYWDNVYVTTTNGIVYFVGQPASQTVAQGRTAEFRALVDGDGPYTYQWSRNGTPIPGAGNWKYITPPLLLSENGATTSRPRW